MALVPGSAIHARNINPLALPSDLPTTMTMALLLQGTMHRRSGSIQRGFTLVELVTVMVVLGVLSAVAAPKIFNFGIFDSRGFHDQTLAYLRFAQKSAVAQRRTVCVSFTANSMSLAMASTAGTTNCTSAVALIGPSGEPSATVSAKAGVAYASAPSPVNFNFDALGQPLNASTGLAQARQTFQVLGASPSITVEASTGYVHD